MKINTIYIENFRQFLNVSLSFHDDITILAGANNSGKTAIVGLFKNILSEEKFKYSKEDIPVKKVTDWIEKVYPIFSDSFKLGLDQDHTIENIVNKIYPSDPTPKVLIDCTTIKIRIDYDTAIDDIRNFADYIMDLEETNHSFYFSYSFKFNLLQFRKLIESSYEKLKTRFSKIGEGEGEDETKINVLKNMIVQIYADSLTEECTFCDKHFANPSLISSSDFKKLFNFQCIKASRLLDDDRNDCSHNLSKGMISLASKDDTWKDLLKVLPDKILEPIQNTGVKETVREVSIKSLSDAMESLSKTNGGHSGEIMLEMDLLESDISDLLKKITSAKYSLDGHVLDESSQGLGYSNMIYIHLQLEEFKKELDPYIVNVFFIEEPESHMHPQMQNVFIKYLLNYYKELKLQGLVTTHSNEMVRVAGLNHLRIIREIEIFNSEIFDLSKLKSEIAKYEDDDLTEDFYDWFFEIGFSEIVFADKAILYEGDTERMYIRKLLTLPAYEALSHQYISFIQVGGAYAYNYKPLIKFLKIKTLIITDIDYDKKARLEADYAQSKTTNSTINKFYKDVMCEDPDKYQDPTVELLIQWKDSEGNKLLGNLVYLAFQTNTDKYARTLEEAMLAKYYNTNVFDTKLRSQWTILRDKLKYSIPYNKENEGDSLFSLRDIVLATSGSKTDFMYSVILNNLSEPMTPDYIKGGLEWLMQ
jgi:predicted ATP-dependent endonuclease of OLD family